MRKRRIRPFPLAICVVSCMYLLETRSTFPDNLWERLLIFAGIVEIAFFILYTFYKNASQRFSGGKRCKKGRIHHPPLWNCCWNIGGLVDRDIVGNILRHS